MKVIKCLAVGLLLLLGVHSASAQLYTRDSSFGADSVVIDVNSGMSWLRLDLSTGLTPTEIWDSRTSNFTFETGVYAGYRVASQGELDRLIDTHVRCTFGPCAFPYSDAGTTDPTVASRALDVIRLFTGEIATASNGGQRGIMSGLVIGSGYPGWNTALWSNSGPTGSYTAADHYASNNGMTYLIAVPEPSTYALMLAGLGCVGFVARRRSRVAPAV